MTMFRGTQLHSGITASIMSRITEAEKTAVESMIRKILAGHRELTNVPIPGFSYRGQVFTVPEYEIKARELRGNWPQLHKLMWPMATKMMDEHAKFLTEMNQVRMHLSNCILQDYVGNRIPSTEHIRNCVHDGMAQLTGTFRGVERTQSLQEVLSPKNWEEHQRIQEKLDFYSAYPLMV